MVTDPQAAAGVEQSVTGLAAELGTRRKPATGGAGPINSTQRTRVEHRCVAGHRRIEAPSQIDHLQQPIDHRAVRQLARLSIEQPGQRGHQLSNRGRSGFLVVVWVFRLSFHASHGTEHVFCRQHPFQVILRFFLCCHRYPDQGASATPGAQVPWAP